MYELILGLGVFIIVVLFHELGHFLYDWIYLKRKPTLKSIYFFKRIWVGWQIPIDNTRYTIYHKIQNHLIGIFFGYVLLIVLNAKPIIFLAYLLACSLDFLSIFSLVFIITHEGYRKFYNTNTIVSEIGCERCWDISTEKLREMKNG